MLVDSLKNIRSFGRTKRTALCNDNRLINEVLPKFTFNAMEKFNLNDIFQNKNKNHLEIGFGYGESLIDRAINNPNINFLACETYINGVANLLSLIEKNQINNIKVIDGDSRLVLENLENNNLEKVYLLFPDPWPKKKQNKRRIINEKFIETLVEKLEKNGTFFFASDIIDYVDWTIKRFNKYSNFHKLFNDLEETKEPTWWVQTRYQEKAIKENRRSYFLEWEKIVF